jgi:N-methylhydantoinase A
MSIERGFDPRRFALVAFGGAGPLHANALAARLGCFPVVVPPAPGVLSAFGFHAAGTRNVLSRTVMASLDEPSAHRVIEDVSMLAEEARSWLAAEGVHDGRLTYACDLRFLRQGYELEIELDQAELCSAGVLVAALSDRFVDLHDRLYGFVPDASIEIVNVRVGAHGRSAVRDLDASPNGRAGAAAPTGSIDRGYFGGVWQPTRLYDRAQLPVGTRLRGPAIIVEPDSTTLVLPDHVVEVDPFLNLLITPEVIP